MYSPPAAAATKTAAEKSAEEILLGPRKILDKISKGHILTPFIKQKGTIY
jgi:hypothetical protein